MKMKSTNTPKIQGPKATYEDLVEMISNQVGHKLNRIEKNKNNQCFELLQLRSKDYFKSVEGIDVIIQSRNSMVKTDKGLVFKVHNAVEFNFSDGSVVTIAPRYDHLQIPHLSVNPSNYHRGTGTRIMNTLLKFIRDVLGYIPEIFIECNGTASYDGENLESNINDQIKFFTRFGFEIEYESIGKEYVTMRRRLSTKSMVAA